MVEIFKVRVETRANGFRITAGDHLLILPLTEGNFLDYPNLSHGVYSNGVFILIGKSDSFLAAYDEVTKKKLWVISDNQISDYLVDEKDGIIGVSGWYDKDGAPRISFSTSWGDSFSITDVRTGAFKYRGWTK
jgi:hypothetical protein